MHGMLLPRQTVVVLYGNSVLLEGIAASLRNYEGLGVLAVPLQTDTTYLKNLHPDLVLVDASQFTPNQTEELIADFHTGYPPPIIRLIMDSQQLTITSTQQFPAASFDDLGQVLDMISKSK